MNPKYYRCIKSNITDFTVGKIYQIKNPDNVNDVSNFISNTKTSNGWYGCNLDYFEPVTDLEWNLQEGIIIPVNKEDCSYLIELLKKLNIV